MSTKKKVERECVICGTIFNPRSLQKTCSHAWMKALRRTHGLTAEQQRIRKEKLNTIILPEPFIPELAAFISSHPTSCKEVFENESVPCFGVVRDTGLNSSHDLHSVLNTRRVRTIAQASPE